MKLAEALVLRADVQKRIEQMRTRIVLCAMVQEGETPPEDPQELLQEIVRLLTELQSLIQRINLTNISATLADGRTITEALAERDTLTLHHSILSTLAEAASPRMDRLGRSEIKKVPTLNVAVIRREMDDIARRWRELDMLIQATNWAIDLRE